MDPLSFWIGALVGVLFVLATTTVISAIIPDAEEDAEDGK